MEAGALRYLLMEVMWGWGAQLAGTTAVPHSFQPASSLGNPAVNCPSNCNKGGWARGLVYLGTCQGWWVGQGHISGSFPGDGLHMCTSVRNVSSRGAGGSARLGMVSAARPPPGCWRLHNGLCVPHKAGIFPVGPGGWGQADSWMPSCLVWSIALPLPEMKPFLPPSLHCLAPAWCEVPTSTPPHVTLWVSVSSSGTLGNTK